MSDEHDPASCTDDDCARCQEFYKQATEEYKATNPAVADVAARIVADIKAEPNDNRLTALVMFALETSSAMADVAAPENVSIPDFIRKEIRPDPIVVERIVKMVEKLIRSGGGARGVWAAVIEAAIMDERPAIELPTPQSRIIKPGKSRLH